MEQSHSPAVQNVKCYGRHLEGITRKEWEILKYQMDEYFKRKDRAFHEQVVLHDPDTEFWKNYSVTT